MAAYRVLYEGHVPSRGAIILMRQAAAAAADRAARREEVARTLTQTLILTQTLTQTLALTLALTPRLMLRLAPTLTLTWPIPHQVARADAALRSGCRASSMPSCGLPSCTPRLHVASPSAFRQARLLTLALAPSPSPLLPSP